MTPEISVIMPTHNRADLLPRAVASVLAQTYPDFELIIVDDASTDSTRDYLEQLDDDRIQVVYRSENGGNASARNDGLQNAQGRYITFLDSDDEFLPTFLAKVTAALNHHLGAGFVLTGRYIIDNGQGLKVERNLEIPAMESQLVALMHRFPGGTNRGLTVRSECIEEIGGFDPALRAAVDTDFVLRLSQRFQFCYVDEPLIRYHKHSGGQVTDASGPLAEAYEIMIEKHRHTIYEHDALHVRFMNKTARLFYEAGKRRRARSYLLASIRRRPFVLSTWGMLFVHELLGVRGPDVYRLMSSTRSNRLHRCQSVVGPMKPALGENNE